MQTDVYYGILTLLPPILIIVVAVLTRKNFESLLVGGVAGFLISSKLGFINATVDAALVAVQDNAWMYLTMGLFGSLIYLLTRSKGTQGFANLVEKFSSTQKKSLIITWILGILVFADDCLNVLTVSVCMKDTMDRQKTPREMLAYVINSTGAPVCVLIPISTWAVYFGGVFAGQPELASLGNASEIYMKCLPFIFYGAIAVVMVPLVCLGVIPKIGAMKKAYERVETTGMVYPEKDAKLNKELPDEDNERTGKLIDFLLPMIVLIVVALLKDDMLLGLVWAIIVCGVLYLPRKVVSFDTFCEDFMAGFASMVPMIAICLAAHIVRLAMNSIGLPAYIINLTMPLVNAHTLPAITFIVVAGLAFITGSNWGIPAVSVPIIVPLAAMCGANLPLVLGAIVSGGTFGSHICFYSDTTILTAQCCGIDTMEHMLSQLPYAVITTVLSVILYLVFGFIM